MNLLRFCRVFFDVSLSARARGGFAWGFLAGMIIAFIVPATRAQQPSEPLRLERRITHIEDAVSTHDKALTAQDSAILSIKSDLNTIKVQLATLADATLATSKHQEAIDNWLARLVWSLGIGVLGILGSRALATYKRVMEPTTAEPREGK